MMHPTIGCINDRVPVGDKSQEEIKVFMHHDILVPSRVSQCVDPGDKEIRYYPSSLVAHTVDFAHIVCCQRFKSHAAVLNMNEPLKVLHLTVFDGCPSGQVGDAHQF